MRNKNRERITEQNAQLNEHRNVKRLPHVHHRKVAVSDNSTANSFGKALTKHYG